MENLEKVIKSFNDFIMDIEKANSLNDSIDLQQRVEHIRQEVGGDSIRKPLNIHPPAPAPPAPHPLPIINNFDMVGFISINEFLDDNTIKEKIEETKVSLKRCLSIINAYAESLSKKRGYLKTDEEVWIAFEKFPFLDKKGNEKSSFSKTLKPIDIAGEIINIIKGFKPKEDRELIRFNEYLGKIARSVNTPFHAWYSLVINTYDVDVIKNGSTITYLPKLKQFYIKLYKDLSGVSCNSTQEISLSFDIDCKSYTLDYEEISQRSKELFADFLNRYASLPFDNNPAFFEGYFKRG